MKKFGMGLLAVAAVLYILAATTGAGNVLLYTIVVMTASGIVLLLAGPKGGQGSR